MFDLGRQQDTETFAEMCYLENRLQPHLLHLSDLVIRLSILSEGRMMSALIPFHHNKEVKPDSPAASQLEIIKAEAQ